MNDRWLSAAGVSAGCAAPAWRRAASGSVGVPATRASVVVPVENHSHPTAIVTTARTIPEPSAIFLLRAASATLSTVTTWVRHFGHLSRAMANLAPQLLQRVVSATI